jgi:hypothetical protein
VDLEELRAQALSDAERAVYASEVVAREKSILVGYVMWFLVGFHYAYVGRWVAQLLFWISGGGLLVWWIIDLFRVPGMIRAHNREVRDHVTQSITALRGGRELVSREHVADGPRLPTASGQWLALVVMSGALLGFGLAGFGQRRFLEWEQRQSAGPEVALCDEETQVAQVRRRMLVAEYGGAAAGAGVGFVVGLPGVLRARRRSRLMGA